MRALLVALAVLLPTVAAAEEHWDLHGSASAAVPPFRVVGNIYYVGAVNIASYLITTPAGHILIDTGTKEMAPVVRAGITGLGYKLADVKIILSGHAHFDHVQGHAEMKRKTGAKVMALGDDATALESGKDRSPLGAEGWEPVKVDRVLKDGDTVTQDGTTLTAHWAPGHTPGCTVWTMAARGADRAYTVAFFACAGPNANVKLVGNPQFPHLVEDTLDGIRRLRALHPDIVLVMHPEALFAGKIDKIKAGAAPHPLVDPGEWTRTLDELEADVKKRVEAERSAAGR
jgi:metallo-beta-lactamase class B